MQVINEPHNEICWVASFSYLVDFSRSLGDCVHDLVRTDTALELKVIP